MTDKTATLGIEGTNHTYPILDGSVGPEVVDIRKLYAETGMFTYDPGFTSTASCQSAITYIDGEKGILLHRGYPIDQLAENSTFMEVAYLLLHGELPKKAELDTLVLCTGFDIWEANIPAIEIIGRDARNLGKWWRDNGFQAYQGVTIPAFPNFVSLAGPYASSGLSYFNTMEYQMRHMDRLFGEVKRRGATTFEITEEANTRYLDRMTELLGDSLFINGNCASARSYYFNPSGEPTLLRPTSTATAIREASDFPISDYRIT